MKSIIYFVLINTLYMKLYAETISNYQKTECSMNGYKSCSDTKVKYIDSDGEWGIENNQWCFIKKQEKSNTNDDDMKTPLNTCSSKILAQGYKCCTSNCKIYYTDNDGTWGYENGKWCGCGRGSQSDSCSSKILAQGYKCCISPNCKVYYTDNNGTWGYENGKWCGCSTIPTTTTKTSNTTTTTTTTKATTNKASSTTTTTTTAAATATATYTENFCSKSNHSGESVTVTSSKIGLLNRMEYEFWADGGDNSATFYSDSSFTCSFQNTKEYVCGLGYKYGSTKTYKEFGHMYAEFKLDQQIEAINIEDYSFIGIYGWTRNPLVEFYIVDNWLGDQRPADWVGDTKYGDFMIDGAMYTLYKNKRFGLSIDGAETHVTQFFSIRKQARDCGTIDITEHFDYWNKLGMELGKMEEIKIIGEVNSKNSNVSGTFDFLHAKIYTW